jgi:hypothetical protein
MLRSKVKKVLGRDKLEMLVEYLKKYTEQERAKKASLRLQMEGQIGIRN